MDAAGTIIGERKMVRNTLFIGSSLSSSTASASDRITANGTAVREKVPVFFSASLNAAFWNSFVKFSSPTKLAVVLLSITA